MVEDGAHLHQPPPSSTILHDPPPPSLLLVARPLPVLWLLRGDVGDGVPGVVNADKQQQQRRRADHEEAHRGIPRSEEHTSELQSHVNLVCRLLLEKKKKIKNQSQCKTHYDRQT